MNFAQQLRNKISSGKAVFGTFLAELKALGVIQILANNNFDFVVIDSEHGSYSIEQIYNLILAAHAAKMTILVRIPLGDSGTVAKILDGGADGIIFPLSCSTDDVRLAVDLTKYPPVGRRGVHMLRPHTQFNPPENSFEYMEKANRTLITAIQIETQQAASLVDDITATEGVDMVYIGPTDLKTNLHFSNKNVDEQLDQITNQTAISCKKHRKIAGYHCNVKDISQLSKLGFSVFGYAAAIKLLDAGAEDFIKQAQKAESNS